MTGDVQAKIGLFSAFPLEYYGGGERFVIRLANELSNRGFAPTLLADSDSGTEERVSRERLSEMLGVEYRRIPYIEPSQAPVWRALFTRLPSPKEFLSFDASLVIANRIPPPSYLLRLRAIRRPVCFMFHGIQVARMERDNPLSAAYSVYLRMGFLVTSPFYRAAKVWMQLVTPEAGEIVSSLGIPSGIIRVITNAIDPSPFSVGRNDANFDIVFIGRIVDIQKGTSFLAKVVEELDKIRLSKLSVTIVGSGPGARDLQSRLSGIEIARFVGQASEPEKLSILNAANLMLSTSRIDPFPVTVLEGLFSGLPVVATSSGGSRFMLSKNESLGNVVELSPKAFVSRIRHFWQSWKANPASYYQGKLARRQMGLDYFSLEQMYVAYAALVQDLLETRR
jgi:glycosyltransferase involved in cell wall biosynthesis